MHNGQVSRFGANVKTLPADSPAESRGRSLPDRTGHLIMASMNPATKKQAAAPKSPAAKWPADWEVAVRVWIERRGKTMLADGLADLLSAIEHTHSISAAARLLGISYRHAWKLVQEGNAAADEPLVLAAVGGVHGGGAHLTPRGKLSLEVFDQLRGNARESAARLLQATLSPRDDEVDTIHLAAAISLQEALGQLLTEYALRQPGLRVRAVYGASNELADHVLAGALCDLFVSADPLHLDRLATAVRIRVKSRRTVAMNSLAAIGPDKDSRFATPRDLLRRAIWCWPTRHLPWASVREPIWNKSTCTKRCFPGWLTWTTRAPCWRRFDRAAPTRAWPLPAMRPRRPIAGCCFRSIRPKPA